MPFLPFCVTSGVYSYVRTLPFARFLAANSALGTLYFLLIVKAPEAAPPEAVANPDEIALGDEEMTTPPDSSPAEPGMHTCAQSCIMVHIHST